MFIKLTQRLPEKKTQMILVNTDLVEQANPRWQGTSGCTLLMDSGRTVAIEENLIQFYELARA